jgi:RNA polymerase sigma factor (sigma-70 family)
MQGDAQGTAAGGDAPVLHRVAAGDPAAVRECLARYGGLVWAIARRFEPREPEDAVQEIFVALWKVAGRFDPAIAAEATFVAMIARRRLIDRRRARARQPELTALPDAAGLEAGPAPHGHDGAVTASVEAAQAARALEQLRPEQREVIVLATCHGLSHAEIAARTKMPLGTVKAHVRRGLLSIRAALLGVEQEEAP